MSREVKHAIVIASREWCEAAASGKTKVYDKLKYRAHGLGPGSVCVVMTKAEKGRPPALYGEFTVKEVREVDASEYSKLASQGLIYKPQQLKPGEKRWIILFEEFRRYPREIPKRELTDVKTKPEGKPISRWIITGLSYINKEALEEIRSRVGYTPSEEFREFGVIEEIGKGIENLVNLINLTSKLYPEESITHQCAELMLMVIGRSLGFKVYTADPAGNCNGRRLGDFSNISKNELNRIVAPKIFEDLSRTDVVWLREAPDYAFEVVIGGSMRDALVRLANISKSGLNVKLFVVAGKNKRSEYEDTIQQPAFTDIKDKCGFISLDSLIKMYILTALWKQSVKDLQLPFY